MPNAIKIIYANYIPDELIQDFRNNLKNELNGEIQIIKDKREYENFTGPEVTDIVIYIGQHLTEIIVSGVLGNTAYSILKYSITKLWAGFRSLIKKRGITEDGNQLVVTINLRNNDKEIEIILKGNSKYDDLETVVDEVFEFLQSHQLAEAFNKPDYIESSNSKPKIRLVYNEEMKKWEPENFGKLRKQFEELRNWINQNIMD